MFKVSTVVDRLEQLVREFHDTPARDYREFGSHCL